MNKNEIAHSELIRELDGLRQEYNSMKELYDGEISECRDAIERLRKSEEKFRLAYTVSPDSININRLSDGMYISVNEGFTKILGYTEKEAIGRTSLEMNIWVNSEDRMRMVREVEANGYIRDMEARFQSKNGKIVFGLISASLIDLEGVPHILTVVRDITVRKKAEESLAKEQFLINALMNNLTDHVYFKDLESKFIRTNMAHAHSFGLEKPEDVIGKSDFDFFKEEDARKAYDDEQAIIKTGQPILKEENLKRKDGSDAWFSVIKMPLRDSSRNIIGTFGISRDITDRKKSDEQIFLLANALESINECVSITDMSDRVLYLNQAFINTYGYNKDDLREESISYIRSPNNPPEITKEILPATLRGGWNGELLNRRKDGTEFPVFLSTAMVKNSLGQPVALIGVAKDITESRKTEAALKESERRLRFVTQSANDAIITSDREGKILGWNSGARNIFGYEESEIMGRSLDTLVPVEDLAIHNHSVTPVDMKDFERVIGKTMELKGLKKDGSVFPLELSISEWETSDGKFYTGILRDISKRKRTELENQILFEITQGVTTTSNLDELLKLIHYSLGKEVYAENCFIALFDSQTNLFSFPYFVDKIDQTPPPISLAKSCSSYVFKTVKPLVLTQAIFDSLVEAGEMELIGTNSPSWIGIPLQTPSKVIGVLVLQHYEKENVYSENDVNFLVSIGSQIAMAIERKKAEEEINLKNEQLLAINAEKDKFFSIIAHDLRGPLSAFVGATQILTEEIQTMEIDEIKDITLSMKTSASNIYSLLENLLEWSRLKRGTLSFISENLNLEESVKGSVELLSESAREKEILISVQIPSEITVSADKHMLETVIRNLVSNAIKFSNPRNNVSIKAGKVTDTYVEVQVHDSGIGMPEELKNKLFMMNEKVSRNGTMGELSSGLGLLLCKEFVEKCDGKIWAESEAGKGSVFYFTLLKVNESQI
jgi:PAS domain S-box-containing protein